MSEVALANHAAKVNAAIKDEDTTEVERWVLRWQYRRILGHGSFMEALLDAATNADPPNLQRLGKGWPELAEAIRRWRNEPGYAESLREKFEFMD